MTLKASVLTILSVLTIFELNAQATLPLNDLSFFDTPGPSWQVAGKVHANPDQTGNLTAVAGTGVLVNLTSDKVHGKDLVSTTQYGDADIDLDYMMAQGANSGIYLQGRYEIQLLDSWTVMNPTSGDNGGIYERWDDARPGTQKGFEGHSPRQNASRAPGLWQHIRISFQAPRFDASGSKTENAKILSVVLNGVPVQENVELSGPTRGAIAAAESPLGPLRLQGDHGSVAFRNIKITSYDQARPTLINLKYSVYKGKFDAEPVYKNTPPEAQGSSAILSSNISNIANEFLVRYTGTLRINQPGEYNFRLNTAGGRGLLKISDKIVIPLSAAGNSLNGKTTLAKGDLPFELLYSKFQDYAKPSLGLSIGGPGIREFVISDANVASGDPVDPILINAASNTILRSFVYLDTIIVTHAVNVGSPQQVHYTYDLDKGMIVQLWRGSFLDATPMWHSRGDGSSRAAGMLLRFGNPVPALQVLATLNDAWSADSAGSGYRPKGYALDDSDRPSFRYRAYNALVNDSVRVLPGGRGIFREVSIDSPVANLYFKVVEAHDIEAMPGGMYLVNDQSYYIRFDPAAEIKPILRTVSGHQELLLPIKNKISYSILF